MLFRHRLMLRMRPALRFIRRHILHIDDRPERLARGIAVGLFVAFLPIFGLHMILAYFLARLVGANRVLAILVCWLNNPLTLFLIHYPAYRLGRLLLVRSAGPGFGPEQLEQLLQSTFSADRVFSRFFTLPFWTDVYNVFIQIGLETLIGGVILGLIVAKIGYWASLHIIQRYRRRKHHFFRKLALRRQKTA